MEKSIPRPVSRSLTGHQPQQPPSPVYSGGSAAADWGGYLLQLVDGLNPWINIGSELVAGLGGKRRVDSAIPATWQSSMREIEQILGSVLA